METLYKEDTSQGYVCMKEASKSTLNSGWLTKDNRQYRENGHNRQAMDVGHFQNGGFRQGLAE